MYRHENLDVFACGNDKENHFWNSLIRQMVLAGMLKKDIEEYGVLKFTKKGVEFLKKPKSFKIVLNNTYVEANADDDEGPESGDEAATDDKLLELLKELRQKEAKKKSLPPFVIFLENSLQDKIGRAHV